MTYVGKHAQDTPDRPAIVMAGSGEIVTFAELDDRSSRLARAWHDEGLRRGDHVALLLDNSPRFYDVAWAAFRSGLYITPINWHFTGPEVAYILGDCGARSLVTSDAFADVVAGLDVELPLMMGRAAPGWQSYEEVLAAAVPEAPTPQWEGATMFYSSGTTGRPKGIVFPLPDRTIDVAHPQFMASNGFGFYPGMPYLSPAPLYHAAPFVTNMIAHRFGATSVVMEHFDAEAMLAAIEKYRIEAMQVVPTMFVRLLKLPEEVRARYDISSLRRVVHAAAPCPVDVKRQMIDWWGPVIDEYYSGSENCGTTWITAEEWLGHPGSVGRASGGSILHICDDGGAELPVGEVGQVWFESPHLTFSYHNDADKTRDSRNDLGWYTLGDVGRLDDEGYLYLTDRKSFMIISGGVNIYPQEAEDALIMHPAVADVAVFGIPDPEMGERVHAVVQPAVGVAPSAELAAELVAFCRTRIAHYKCPRAIDFEGELPRHETGKLYKRLLRDRYWGDSDSRIVL